MEHKMVMPQVGFGKYVVQDKEDHRRPVQLPCPYKRVLEGVVSRGSLTLLHPIEHIIPGKHGFLIQLPDAFGRNFIHSLGPPSSTAGTSGNPGLKFWAEVGFSPKFQALPWTSRRKSVIIVVGKTPTGNRGVDFLRQFRYL
jgi:hypothetical protein